MYWILYAFAVQMCSCEMAHKGLCECLVQVYGVEHLAPSALLRPETLLQQVVALRKQGPTRCSLWQRHAVRAAVFTLTFAAGGLVHRFLPSREVRRLCCPL